MYIKKSVYKVCVKLMYNAVSRFRQVRVDKNLMFSIYNNESISVPVLYKKKKTR